MGHGIRDRSGSRREVSTIVILSLLATAFRVYDLGEESLWNDEVTSMQDALGLGPGLVLEQLGYGRPLYYPLLRGWIEIFGTSEVAMRSLSALLGIAAVPALYLLGRELFDRRVGLFAATLLAFSRLHIHWSQEARMYSLFVLLTIVSFYWYTRVVRRASRRTVVGYVVSTVLLGYTHLFAALVLLAQNAAFPIIRDELKEDGPPTLVAWLGIQTGIGVALAPWLVAVLGKTLSVSSGEETVVSWISPPTPVTLLTAVGQHVYSAHSASFLLVGVFGGAGLVLYGIRSAPEWRDEQLTTALWYVCLVAVPFALSYLVTPIFVTRYTIAALPAALLLVACGLGALLLGIESDGARRAAVLGLVVVLALPLGPYYGTDQNGQWREAGQHLEENVDEDGLVLITKSYTRKNLMYYVDREDIVVRAVGSEANRSRLDAVTAGYSTVWVVVSNADGRERRRFLERLNGTRLMVSGDDRRRTVFARAAPWNARRNASFVDVHVYRFVDEPGE